MNLGHKLLNDLTSKDEKASNKAAFDLICNSDTEAFKILSSKSDFIFDFIKQKIKRVLISNVDENNVLNLLNFLDIYSEDFSDFILLSLNKYKNDKIISCMKEKIQTGSNSAKTYAIKFFIENDDDFCINCAKKYINSEYEPLKDISIKALAVFSEKDEYNSAINILKSDKDNLDKLEAVDFLVRYGDKDAFNHIFEYFKASGEDEITASNLICLKSFNELIKEENNEAVIRIFASILRAYPDNISFFDIENYLEDGLFEYILENDNDSFIILAFYLLYKNNLILENEAYLADLSFDEQKSAKVLSEKLSSVLISYNKEEIIKNSISGNFETEVLIALEMADDKIYRDEIESLIKKNTNEEILLCAIKALKNLNLPYTEFVEYIKNKTENTTIKAEFESLL